MAKVVSWSDALKAYIEIDVGGESSSEPIATKTADYTITTSDKNIFCDCFFHAVF